MLKPEKEHWTVVNMVFRNLCETKNYAFFQGRPGPRKVIDVHVFFDAYWDGYLDRIRYTSGYVFNLFGGAINWMRKR